MTLISHDYKSRTYFFEEYDTAKSFEHFYSGDFEYCDGGYLIKI